MKLEAPRVAKADGVTLPTPVRSGALQPAAPVAVGGERVARARRSHRELWPAPAAGGASLPACRSWPWDSPPAGSGA